MNESISLEPVCREHRKHLFAQYSHPECVHMAAFVFGDPCDRDAFDARLDRLLASPEILYRTILLDDQPIGAVASFVMEGEREITYGIHPDFWGRGITTQAVKLFLNLEQTRPLHARAAGDNGASLRILEKCGFVKAGTETSFAPPRNKEIEEVLLVLN